VFDNSDLEEAAKAGIYRNIALISESSTREQLAKYGCPICEKHDEVAQLLDEML